MDYTHIVIEENYNLICVEYNKENQEKYPKGLPINLDNIPTFNPYTMSNSGIEREGKAKSLFLKIWSEAQNISLYDKSIWNKFDDIIFSTYRTDEELEFLAKNYRIQWALAQTSKSIENTLWESFYHMI